MTEMLQNGKSLPDFLSSNKIPIVLAYIASVIILFALLLGIFLLVNYLMRRHEIRKDIPYLKRVRHVLKAPVILLLLLLAILIPLSLFPPEEELSRVSHKILYILSILGISWLLILITFLFISLAPLSATETPASICTSIGL